MCLKIVRKATLEYIWFFFKKERFLTLIFKLIEVSNYLLLSALLIIWLVTVCFLGTIEDFITKTTNVKNVGYSTDTFSWIFPFWHTLIPRLGTLKTGLLSTLDIDQKAETLRVKNSDLLKHYETYTWQSIGTIYYRKRKPGNKQWQISKLLKDKRIYDPLQKSVKNMSKHQKESIWKFLKGSK